MIKNIFKNLSSLIIGALVMGSVLVAYGLFCWGLGWVISVVPYLSLIIKWIFISLGVLTGVIGCWIIGNTVIYKLI